MSNPLEGELLATQRKLSGLVEDTEAAIGDVAKHGYKELNKLPAAEHHPLDVPAPGYGFHPDQRFFKARRIVRAAELPSEPVVMEDRDITVTETATELFRRQHYDRRGQPILRLPVQDKLVTVEFSRPGDEDLLVPRTASASTKGYATYGRRTDYTYPLAAGRSHLTPEYGGYPNSDALQADYASSFSSALAVIGFVAESLSRAHGIQSDTKELGKLQHAWQRVSPGEMHPNIAVLLPKKA
jgi:hypothetical protein